MDVSDIQTLSLMKVRIAAFTEEVLYGRQNACFSQKENK